MMSGDERSKRAQRDGAHTDRPAADDVWAAPESGQPPGGRDPSPSSGDAELDDRAAEKRTPKGENL